MWLRIRLGSFCRRACCLVVRFQLLLFCFSLRFLAKLKGLTAITHITNSAEQSPSLHDSSSLADQEIHYLLWNPKIHYRVHKNPSLDPVFSQLNPVPTITLYCFKISFNIKLHIYLLLVLPIIFFLEVFRLFRPSYRP